MEDFENFTGIMTSPFPYGNETYGNETYGNETEQGRGFSDDTNVIIIVTILYAMVFLFGITGNALVVFVIFRNPDMSTATNIFLVNLSLADLLVLLVCMPSALIELHGRDVWILGNFMCKVVSFLEIGVTNTSMMTMLAISFERYYAICRPLEVLYTCTKGRAVKIIVSVWTFSLLSASPFFSISFTENSEFLDGTFNIVCRSPIDTNWKHIYTWAITGVFFVCPCIILSALYICICKELLRSRRAMINHHDISFPLSVKHTKKHTYSVRQSTNGSSSNRRSPRLKTKSVSSFGCHYAVQHTRAVSSRRQVIYMLITVIVFSFSCLLPFRILTLWLIYSSGNSKEWVGTGTVIVLICISRCLFYLNSAGNPILYNVMSTKFRQASKRSLDMVCIGGKITSNSMRGSSATPSRQQSCRRCESTTKDSLDCESLAPLNFHDNALSGTNKTSA